MTAALAAALGILALLNTLTGRAFHPPIPPPDSLRLGYETAVQSVALMGLGMRRLAADLEFIRLLMYYGSGEGAATPERHAEHPEHEGHEGHGGRTHHEAGRGAIGAATRGRGTVPAGRGAIGAATRGRAIVPAGDHSGEYLELAERAIRVLDLDPFFGYAVEYAAGALAFNLQRPDDALAVLRHALARDNRNWKYQAYVGAIAFHKKGDAAKVRAELAPVADDPQAPTMLKHILAFLNMRLGRREDAIRLYRQILQARDKDYHHFARQALKRLDAPEQP